MSKNACTNEPVDAEPPRQEVESFGEPVGKEQIDGEYWEAYSSSDNPELLFIAHYVWDGSKWVKQGLDRHRVSNLFNTDDWPTD